MGRAQPVLQDALDHQWERELRRGSRLRVVGISLWVGFLGVLGFTVRPDVLPTLPYLIVYLVLAVIFARRFRALDAWRKWSATLLDLPMINLAMHASLPASTDPASIAVVSWAFNFGVIIANPAILYARPLAASCVVGFGLSVWHMASVHVPGSWYFGTAMVYAWIYIQARFSTVRIIDIAEDFVRENKLSAFFSPSVAENLRNTSGNERGRLQEVTVLVSDIRGFTSVAEALGAEEVVGLLNEYLAGASAVVAKHGGTIDKFLGDGMLAYFTEQPGGENHALRAVRCGLEMLATIERLNERKTLYGEQSLSMGIGVHTGEVVVGSIGSSARREHTIIGDTVNVTARIEGMTKSLGARMLVSGAARSHTGETFSWIDCGEREIRGRSEFVALFEPVARTGTRPQPVQIRLAPEADSSADAVTEVGTKPGRHRD